MYSTYKICISLIHYFYFIQGAGEIAVRLKSVDISSNLNDHQRLDIADTCTLKVFRRGDNIVEAGKRVNYTTRRYTVVNLVSGNTMKYNPILHCIRR